MGGQLGMDHGTHNKRTLPACPVQQFDGIVNEVRIGPRQIEQDVGVQR